MRGDHRDGAAEKRAGGRKSIVVDEVENSVHVCEMECGGCGYGKDLHALDGQWWLWFELSQACQGIAAHSDQGKDSNQSGGMPQQPSILSETNVFSFITATATSMASFRSNAMRPPGPKRAWNERSNIQLAIIMTLLCLFQREYSSSLFHPNPEQCGVLRMSCATGIVS
ncbi:hypothetical protein RRG08_047228 [Elysia crispata]|uniref:Uncharacterized protein n=1 Tax=Elysia crispata TaxID=231223 RepID=A0AAE1B8K2_9GAST|nr:hypothetical protein RRG08_047228 [Elysia crispata]